MSGSGILQWGRRDDRIAVLTMNDPAEAVNVLKRELIEEFESALSELEAMPSLEVFVFTSAKPDSFIAGADLNMLRGVDTAAQARQLAEVSQSIQQRIAALPAATVAAIHGPCLGGGLEVALAFDYRVASDDPRTRLGLPEVQLGVLPGGGGTQRLPRLVGLEQALDLLLTGRQLAGRRALRIGLVDRLAPKEVLLEAAVAYPRERQRSPGLTRRLGTALAPAQLRKYLLGGNPLGRKLVFDQARSKMLKKTRGNYPAPAAILDVVRTGFEQGAEAGWRAEAEAFGELVVSPQARQLIELFFANNALKKESGVSDGRVQAKPISKIGVLGAGLMGAGIAYVSIDRARAAVRLKDRDDDSVGRGLMAARRLVDRRVSRRSINGLEGEQILSRLSGTVDYSGFANCDLVVEAVFEDLDLKRQILRDIEELAGAQTIFASNTSAIPIGDIADVAQRPENVLGLHYFSPVEKMPLLEIVVTPTTAPWVVASCVEFGKRQGKTVIVVSDGPGFYTTRILAAYLNEATRVLCEGVTIDRIDEALLDFGFPVGPLALLDEVGIDVGQKVAATLHQALGDRFAPVPQMEALLEDDRRGRKNRKGLYRYDDRAKKGKGKKEIDEHVYRLLDVTANDGMDPQSIVERCVLRMVNEAAHCLAEEVVRGPRDGDVGAVFGLGFPPFRGGPFRYIDGEGSSAVRDRLQGLADEHGARFRPAPVFEESSKFYT